MTKGMEDFFDLPPLEEVMGVDSLSDEHAKKVHERLTVDEDTLINEANATAADARQKMMMLDGADHSEAMDSIFRDAKKHATDLVDLAFNSDLKSTARIAEVAAQMYKIGIDAKNSKMEIKLKAMKLALEQQKIDMDRLASQQETGNGNIVEARGVIIEDRNELIRRAREQMKKGE